jgi:chaperonin GroES
MKITSEAKKFAKFLVPIGNKILIKRIEAQDMKGKIFIPQVAKDVPKQGIILALGEGELLEDRERKPFNVKVGDEVVFATYAGTQFKYEDIDYMVCTEDEVLVLVKEK